MSAELEQIAVDQIRCPRCSAYPTRPCLTRSGRVATSPHVSRTWPTFDAYHLGVRDGAQDAASMARHFLYRVIDGDAGLTVGAIKDALHLLDRYVR